MVDRVGCELCSLARTTHWYVERTTPLRFAILDCDSCDVPMAVLGEHRTAISGQERSLMQGELAAIATAKWGEDWFFDDHMRQIPDHYHCHVRPLPPGWKARRRTAQQSVPETKE